MTNRNYNRIKKFTQRAINEYRKVEDYDAYGLECLAFEIAERYRNRHHYYYKLSFEELYYTVEEILDEIAGK